MADLREREALLKEAVAAAPESTSPAMDLLRTELAFVIFMQRDREDEALDLLRERINAGDAFGELLRGFAFLAGLLRRLVLRDLSVYADDYIDDELAELRDDDETDEDEDEGDGDEADEDGDLTPAQLKMLENASRLMEQSEKLEIRASKLETRPRASTRRSTVRTATARPTARPCGGFERRVSRSGTR